MPNATIVAILTCSLAVVILIPLGIISARRRVRTRNFYSLCRAIGSASKLTGEVCHAVVFLHRQGIDSGRMQSAQKSFQRARQFLTEQAWHHQKNLTFKPLFHMPFKMKTGNGILDNRLIKRLSKRFGHLFKPGPDLGHRSYFILVFTELLPEDRGKAVVGIDPYRPPGHPEFCICSIESSPAVIAHEILHLFGARDLEGSDSSVMERVDRPVEELSIDDKTAYAVGWRDRLDE